MTHNTRLLKQYSPTFPFTVFKFNTLESTNDYVKQHLGQLPDYSVVWALEQTKGRGRFLRRWYSTSGRDLTFSIIIPLERFETTSWPILTLATGFSIECLFATLNTVDAKIKWPNDIRVRGQKLCGILCELLPTEGKPRLCVGIGINVNCSREDLVDIGQKATSLFIESGKEYVLEDLLHVFLSIFQQTLVDIATLGFSHILQRFQEKLEFIHTHVKILDGNTLFEGKIEGIDSHGALLLKEANGEIRRIIAGEIIID